MPNFRTLTLQLELRQVQLQMQWGPYGLSFTSRPICFGTRNPWQIRQLEQGSTLQIFIQFGPDQPNV